jgi:hypothetical protein
MQSQGNLKAARPMQSYKTSIPHSSTAHLMCYLKAVKIILDENLIPDWAADFNNHHITDDQFLQLMSYIDHYNPNFMKEKYLLIQITKLPNNKLNMFFDTPNLAACGSLPGDLISKIEKSNALRVMLCIPQ